MFAAFILGCGLTHLLDAAMFWWPAYRLNSAVRVFTGVKIFVRLTKVLAHLRAGRADGSYDRRLQNLLKPDLLILDDFGLKPLTPPGDEDFHELVSERYQRGSIVITSNLDFSEWGAVFPNQVLGAATVDRLRDQAHRIIIEGESYRKPKSIPKDKR